MHHDLSTLFDLTGRTAIVTGGSRGLGRAMALGFAKAGANVVVASRDLVTCEQTVAEVTAAGGIGLACSVRMGEPDDIAPLVAATVERFGGISIVVNNAATVLDRSLDRIDAATFAGAFGTNLLGPMLLVREALPHLAASGHGSVINVLSVAWEMSTVGRYYYPPVKAALRQVTGSMAREFAAQNVRVNALAPGTFRTDMTVKAFDESGLNRIAGTTPLGRVGNADEIVGPALMLASDAGSFITGTVLTVDAGATC